jgi:hypothetical protein
VSLSLLRQSHGEIRKYIRFTEIKVRKINSHKEKLSIGA